MEKTELSRQQQRTRRTLLQTAGRLLQAGKMPTMEEVAEAALVSRATIYRYFPNIDALLAEAPLETGMQDAAALFAHNDTQNPVERIDRVEAYFHEFSYRQEKQLRVMLARSLLAGQDGQGLVIRRQNRRSELIDAALRPAREQFDDAVYQKLCASLAMLIGAEAMIVCEDVLRLSPKRAREAKSWAVRALVNAALQGQKTHAK